MMKIILKNKLEEKDRVPPKSAQEAAKKVLEWKEKYKSEVKGMTETGWRRARQIAAGKPLALETIKKISQFSRHEKNKTIKKEFKATPWKDNGYVAWLGWGGDTAILTWSKKVIEKAEREKKQNGIITIINSAKLKVLENESENPKKKARAYKTRFLEAGLVQYGEVKVLIKNENLMRIAETFRGIPVVIGHPEEFEEGYNGEKTVGYVTKVYYNADDGWAWCDLIVDNDNAISLIDKKGYTPSCAYIPTETKDGGIYHAIEYEQEIVNAKPIHFGLVEEPRYEDVIILQNSVKGNKEMKLFKKNEEIKQEDAKLNEAESKKEIDFENAYTELENGDKVSLQELVDSYNTMKEKKNEEEKEKENRYNQDDEIDIDGESVKISELVENFNKYKNEQKEEEEKENEKKEEEKKENSLKKEESKKHFDLLKNAAQSSCEKKEKAEVGGNYVTSIEAFKNGQMAYGSGQKIENK